ncbi:MAG: hypothetical protein ACRC5C_15205 [Bacilli bacterium]
MENRRILAQSADEYYVAKRMLEDDNKESSIAHLKDPDVDVYLVANERDEYVATFLVGRVKKNVSGLNGELPLKMDTPVGYISLDNVGELLDWTIHRDYRGLGHYRMFFCSLYDLAIARNVDVWRLQLPIRIYVYLMSVGCTFTPLMDMPLFESTSHYEYKTIPVAMPVFRNVLVLTQFDWFMDYVRKNIEPNEEQQWLKRVSG